MTDDLDDEEWERWMALTEAEQDAEMERAIAEFYRQACPIEELADVALQLNRTYRPARFLCDPSGHTYEGHEFPPEMEYLKQHGLGSKVKKGMKDVDGRIQLGNALINQGRMYWSANCPNWIREMEAWGWNTHGNDFALADVSRDLRPQSGGDHAIDAGFSAVYYAEGKKRDPRPRWVDTPLAV